MIVEDSPTVRELIVHIVNQDPRLEVVAVADSGEKALQILDQIQPDVISMDIRLPGMTGFEATQKIMQIRPTPIVVVSASVEAEDLKISMNALRAGALSVVEKPTNFNQVSFHQIATKICTQLAIMSEVKVVSQRLNTGRNVPLMFSPDRQPPLRDDRVKRVGTYKMLGLVASTGGPKALCEILRNLPLNFPLPIFVVQHITASFHDGFVSWLDSITRLSVMMVKAPRLPVPGDVYLAPADHHLIVQNGYVLPSISPPVCRQRPSGTVLFQSMAGQAGQSAIGVLLTGMGEDGASGLKAIRDAGGYTIAEDASSAVVYGMPAAAVELDAVSESLPLDKITFRILELAANTQNGVMTYACH
ncbi:MAG: chemotaxis-specific protein-glutamate methyltransferase CheB [Pseudomonadota bacterium]